MKPKKCYDTTKAIFIYSPDMDDCESGFASGEDLVITVSSKWVEDPLFYIHEFTEITITRWFRRNRIPIRWNIQFEGFRGTTVPHLISPFGEPNQRCIMPQQYKKQI